MAGRAELIQCSTLIIQAENDSLADRAGVFFDALRCAKALMRCTAAEGADGAARWKTAHCSIGGPWTGLTNGLHQTLNLELGAKF
jgi:hypothetical protein